MLDSVILKKICPCCNANIVIDLKAYIDSTTAWEREMGSETEYVCHAEEYNCPECGDVFAVEGYIYEYPEGCLNMDEVKLIPYDCE